MLFFRGAEFLLSLKTTVFLQGLFFSNFFKVIKLLIFRILTFRFYDVKIYVGYVFAV